ncbi:hypothetical protein OAB57_04050, partial [Bacteriovoracaceae bacterium]|nr:hypothetical protein [Bacteriovoracaceae bacterium]
MMKNKAPLIFLVLISMTGCYTDTENNFEIEKSDPGEVLQCSLPTSRDCSISLGKGTQTRTCSNELYSHWSECSFDSCYPGYFFDNIAGTCQKSCSTDKSMLCDIKNGKGISTKSCEAGRVVGDWSKCIATNCNNGFYLENNACHLGCEADVKLACVVPNGQGVTVRECLEGRELAPWIECLSVTCNDGHYFDRGECKPRCNEELKSVCSLPGEEHLGYRTRECRDNSYSEWSNCVASKTEFFSNPRAFAVKKGNGQIVAWGDVDMGGKIPSHLYEILNGNVRKIVGNDCAFAAILDSGKMVSWGVPNCGGTINTTSSTSDFSQVVPLRERWYTTASVFAGVTKSGQVYTWGGRNIGGRVDNFSRSILSDKVKEVIGSGGAYAALKHNGNVVIWGDTMGWSSDFIEGVEITTEYGIKKIVSSDCGFA